MVPFLTSILSTMLPMLGMAKHDAARVAFCGGKRGSLKAGEASGAGLGAACPPPPAFAEGHEWSGLQEEGRAGSGACRRVGGDSACGLRLP